MLLTNWDPAESVVWGTTWTYTHTLHNGLKFEKVCCSIFCRQNWDIGRVPWEVLLLLDLWIFGGVHNYFTFLGGFELPLSLCDGTNWLCNSLFHAKSNRVRVDKYWQPFKICIVMDSTTIGVIKPDIILFLVFTKFFGKMSWTRICFLDILEDLFSKEGNLKNHQGMTKMWRKILRPFLGLRAQKPKSVWIVIITIFCPRRSLTNFQF